MNSSYIKAHEKDDIYSLLNQVILNAKNQIEMEREGLSLKNSIPDRWVFNSNAKEYKERVEWCVTQIKKIVADLMNEAATPIQIRSVPKEILMEALAPNNQPVNFPHFTIEQVNFLDYYFWLVPKPVEEWAPISSD